MSGAILLLPTYAFMAWTGTAFTFLQAQVLKLKVATKYHAINEKE
jgi:hypothetical protein